MDGVSTILAIASFSIQLVETTQKANRFLKEVQNAPAELIKLVNTLDALESLLLDVHGLIERLNAMSGLPSSVDRIGSALKRCQTTVMELDASVRTFQEYFARHGRLHKAWASIKTVVRKEKVEQLRKQIEGDMGILNTALSINMFHLQLHQFNNVSSPPLRDPSTQHQNSAINTCISNSMSPTNLVARNASASLKTIETDAWQYRTFFGEFRLRKRLKFLGDDGRYPEQALNEENCLSFVSYLCRSRVELRFCEGFFQVPRSLSVFPVILQDDVFRDWCRPSNIEAFKQALSRRELSPYSRDKLGQTFLHEAVFFQNTELCSLLIQLGVDADHRDDDGEKALHNISLGLDCDLHILRTLMSPKSDIDFEDLVLIFGRDFWGSPEAAKLLLSAAGLTSDSDQLNCLLLSAALRQFGSGKKGWETWLQRLLRSKIDVHSGISDFRFVYRVEKATALDNLFRDAECPFEAESAAQEWLSMLVEAGYDVHEYLEEEKQLHSRYNYLTDDHFKRGKRQLVFELNGNPSVRWEWWFPAKSPGWPVCQEFRDMNPAHDDWGLYYHDAWIKTWPFEYPAWAENCGPYEDIWPIEDQAGMLRSWQEDVWYPWLKRGENVARRHARQARKKYPRYFERPGQKSAIPGAWVD